MLQSILFISEQKAEIIPISSEETLKEGDPFKHAWNYSGTHGSDCSIAIQINTPCKALTTKYNSEIKAFCVE